MLDGDTGGRTPAAGEQAPDFALPDSSGVHRRLSDLVRHTGLVLVFYRGHW